ncbi:MAG: hypothetical protein B0W54_03765 [Cellvibrio sp. 79]|nr:MAG: hypothetical protein B0W54_03765 [Cellvibrio sp. 79]
MCHHTGKNYVDMAIMSQNLSVVIKPIILTIGLTLTIFTPHSFAREKESTGKSVTKVVIACEENLKQDHDDYYYSNLLRLALSKTVPTHGEYQLEFIPVMPITNRLLRDIERGEVDVTWMPYAKDLKYNLTPIKIRLLKELSDYRVFLIRAQDKEKFSTIKNIEDLRKLKGGIGSHWPDRQVMEENGLPLVLSLSYFNLFKMLKSNRFDYFSRGIYQVRTEVDTYADQGIALEKYLFLRYENPVYFYLHKDNQKLADRIETGLKLAIEDGSFNKLFNSIENLRWGEKLLDEKKRRVIQLNTFDK